MCYKEQIIWDQEGFVKFLGVGNPNGYLVSVWKQRDQGEVRIIVRNVSVTYSGTSEVSDLARAEDLHWEGVRQNRLLEQVALWRILKRTFFF